MKKAVKLFFILVTVLFSTVSFASTTLFQMVEATYVEGLITQDTIWTLVDSPFVVSKNITVCSTATLTIEPEVEVKFGGDFWLIVEGRLVADGTEDKIITFTSNKYEPEAGDWGAIEFMGTEASSLMRCIIEYGTNGITVESGTVNIQNSLVSLNSENGIMITNGNVEVKNNEIFNNTESGIYIAGGNQVNVQNNNITSNGDGITLTGNATSEINIRQNEILLNKQSGILLEADAYYNTIIVNNTISTNFYGFYVSTNASTYITQNYVSNNNVGIFYGEGMNHRAYFNDIYDNSLGMDVYSRTDSEEIVNAEYNYWGDRSGPYHESLNPSGIGNPVSGNGVDLDFIFFLTAPIDYENTRPIAILWTDKILVAPNQTVTFIGTDSYDEGRVDQYFFDFGDGMNSSWTTLSLFTHNYSSTGIYNAELTVKDDCGNKSDSSVAAINVQTLTPLEASITLSNYTVNHNEEVLVTVYVSNGTSAVGNATVMLFSVKGGSFTPLSGLTDSTGYFTTIFTAPNVTEVTDVRIIGRASKAGYADGSNHKYLKVLPPLTVQVTAKPATIKSEETTTVTIHVTAGFEQPVPDVLLLLWSDYGDFSPTVGVTDVNGSATFLFTAPQTLSQINVTVTATAIKLGYAEEQGQGTITVEPKVLVVEIATDPTIIVSEAASTVTAYVTYDSAPISDVTVTASSDSGGNFSTATETTDLNGKATFVFSASQTTTMISATITVTATKSGYAVGESLLNVTVNPGILTVEVTSDPSTIASSESTVVTVYTKCNETPVANASVTVLSSDGTFSVTNGTTDSEGRCILVFNAPRTTAQLSIIVTANVTKNGYISGQSETIITVTPETGGGWPLMTILLIIIPIAIVVIIVVLVKLKVITFSVEEES